MPAGIRRAFVDYLGSSLRDDPRLGCGMPAGIRRAFVDYLGSSLRDDPRLGCGMPSASNRSTFSRYSTILKSILTLRVALRNDDKPSGQDAGGIPHSSLGSQRSADPRKRMQTRLDPGGIPHTTLGSSRSEDPWITHETDFDEGCTEALSLLFISTPKTKKAERQLSLNKKFYTYSKTQM